jgi:hypothetical protein
MTFLGALALPSPSSLMPAGASAERILCASVQSITPTV